MKRLGKSPVRALDSLDVASRIEPEHPPRTVRPWTRLPAAIAIAGPPPSVEERARRERHARRHLAGTPNGHTKGEPRVTETLEKGEALLHLASQGPVDDARVQAEVLHQDLTMEAMRRDGSKKRTGQRVVVGDAILARISASDRHAPSISTATTHPSAM